MGIWTGVAGAQLMGERVLGRPVGKKVSFLIAGTQKGGTTALSAYLARHPQIFIPAAKEVHFFDNDDYDWVQPDWSLYHQHFKTALAGQCWGEATPITMWWRPAIDRLWRYNRDIKILFILRNPITRAYSHWNMEYQRGVETLPFLDALKQEVVRCRAALPAQHRVFSYVDRGFYSCQLRELWRYFPRDQVMVIRQEHLAEEPADTMISVERFLGLKSVPFAGSIQAHQRSYESPIPAAAFELLRRTFWHEICQLQTLLGWDCSDWLEAR